MYGILHKFRGKGTKSKKSGTPNAPNPEDVHVGTSYSEFDPSSYQRVVVEESTHISFTLREGGGTKEKVGEALCAAKSPGVPSVPCDPPSHMNLNGCRTDILLQWYNSGGISVDALIRQVSEQQYTDYWARVSVGMLLPPTYRGVNVDFVGASGLKEDVVVTPEANWVIPITCRNCEIFNLRVPPIDKDLVPHLPIDANLTPAQLKTMLEDYMHAMASMASFICKMNSGLHSSKDDILEYARQELNSHDISYSEYPEVVAPQMTPPQVQTRPSISREDVYVPHFAGESTDPAVRYSSSQGEGSSSYEDQKWENYELVVAMCLDRREHSCISGFLPKKCGSPKQSMKSMGALIFKGNAYRI
ncbi:hypothetical protein IFM89_022188 [Coptis chinensis]|uniref:Uncharacterized protein n=1 Tax=Coptis chinensis TaxID=261450 RepID=A0A835LCC1_9MAGN|nr:hypothetical protein IFM89_022188 [Coptis chinensis]